MPEERLFTVGELNRLIKGVLEGIPAFGRLSVEGEISNWKVYRSGAFFDLKDKEGNVLSCQMWNSDLSRLSFVPQDGDAVISSGKLSVYVPRGRYSLSVYRMEKSGAGSALLALEALKKKLVAEGLFDPSRKRPIPSFPKAIGIVCGKDSAAESDLLRNLVRRWPLLEIYEFPSLVQGVDAPKSLVAALKRASSYPIDTLIIARGGGSNEDLGAFNDEAVVRALASFKCPTISAVGHEVDVTLVDFASDLRVSTPTAAAEAATPDGEAIKEGLLESEANFQEAIETKLERASERLLSLSSRPFFKNPMSRFEDLEKSLRVDKERMNYAINARLERENRGLEALKRNLLALSPNAVLKRGYSILEGEDGKILSSVKEIEEGSALTARLSDGIIKAKVLAKKEEN